MSIKKFEEYICEGITPRVSYLDDDYSVVDGLFDDFDLSKITLSEWKKQYVNFKSLIVLQPCFGNPLLPSWKKRKLEEGYSRETVEIELAQESICRQYELEDWQFQVKIYANDIRVGIIIPNIDENESKITEDMTSMGYYALSKGTMDINGMEYFFIRFDPRYPKDITDIVRKMGVIKHITPKYNLDSIRKNGFIPSHKNELFYYPPRIHFLKESISEKNIIRLGEQLFDYNSNPKNNGEYVLLTLDVKKIPDNVEFIGDSCYKYGICTENEIPFECVVDIKEYNFS